MKERRRRERKILEFLFLVWYENKTLIYQVKKNLCTYLRRNEFNISLSFEQKKCRYQRLVAYWHLPLPIGEKYSNRSEMFVVVVLFCHILCLIVIEYIRIRWFKIIVVKVEVNIEAQTNDEQNTGIDVCIQGPVPLSPSRSVFFSSLSLSLSSSFLKHRWPTAFSSRFFYISNKKPRPEKARWQ